MKDKGSTTIRKAVIKQSIIYLSILMRILQLMMLQSTVRIQSII